MILEGGIGGWGDSKLKTGADKSRVVETLSCFHATPLQSHPALPHLYVTLAPQSLGFISLIGGLLGG